ncbi:hypothetical protein LKL35_32915 [Streptomyces sp. ET3-23]|uniref:hypothetical protein n=1 Tax=Streptomyces sp. ET3-23 TaxID=2885643 RepID=UPI001D120341|nr:hypothetical protein [Streptomyces sp. ET3-23]MCC2280186.1 hypothetical protein [Streptomyces sp. ET3-23]
MQNHSSTAQDSDSAARHARFGALPERIAYEDMVEVKAALPRDPERDAGDSGAGRLLACMAWDLVL